MSQHPPSLYSKYKPQSLYPYMNSTSRMWGEQEEEEEERRDEENKVVEEEEEELKEEHKMRDNNEQSLQLIIFCLRC